MPTKEEAPLFSHLIHKLSDYYPLWQLAYVIFDATERKLTADSVRTANFGICREIFNSPVWYASAANKAHLPAIHASSMLAVLTGPRS